MFDGNSSGKTTDALKHALWIKEQVDYYRMWLKKAMDDYHNALRYGRAGEDIVLEVLNESGSSGN